MTDKSDKDVITIDWKGGSYTGEVSDGVPHGQGIFALPDGFEYVGEFKDGLFHGQGIFTFTDGAQYVGELKDNNHHGQGTFTFPDGSKYVGEWKDGNPWNGTEYDEDGEITATYSDGVITEK